MTALAAPAQPVTVQTEPATTGDGAQARSILDHIGEASEPPHISPARGPPLWDDRDAQAGEGVKFEPDWDLEALDLIESLFGKRTLMRQAQA